MRRDVLTWITKSVMLGLAAFALAWLIGERTGQAVGKRSDAVVKVKAAASALGVDGKQTVTVTLDVDKGWHIYANPVENDMLTSIQTVVSINAQTKPADVKVTYPAGKLHDDKKDKFYFYDGKVTILVQVQRAAGDVGPLEATIRFCACDDSSCLSPATKKITLP
jgi:uncharacterized protein